MRRGGVWGILFSGVLVAFACLLLAGMPHMIAGDGGSHAPPSAAAGRVALVSAPAPSSQTDGAKAEQTHAERQEESVRAFVRLGLVPSVVLRTDANGNVLGHRSYLHTVYRAFALGDGFA